MEILSYFHSFDVQYKVSRLNKVISTWINLGSGLVSIDAPRTFTLLISAQETPRFLSSVLKRFLSALESKTYNVLQVRFFNSLSASRKMHGGKMERVNCLRRDGLSEIRNVLENLDQVERKFTSKLVRRST